MRYLHQVDYIKCFATISVIVLHSVPLGILATTFAVFHIWQAVPIFIIAMGFNISLSKKAPMYSIDYFRDRYKRIIKPFLLIFFISLGFGFSLYRDEFYIGWMNIIGLMPKTGPGNYYITILLQFILFAPVIYWAFKRKPELTVVSLFLLDILFQLFAMNVELFKANQYLYSGSIFRYLSALVIGMWLAKDFGVKSKRNRWIIVGSVFSTIYLLTGHFYSVFSFHEGWTTQNVFSFFYPALLVMIGLNFFPNMAESNFAKICSLIGRSSYHIFLVQMIYFGLVPVNSFALELSKVYNYYAVGGVLVVFNVVFCSAIGLLFYKVDKLAKGIGGDAAKLGRFAN